MRHQLLTLARQKKRRRLDAPCNWRPYEVVDPISDQPFTTQGAWEHIVELLEDENQVLEAVRQDNPPGTIAYVIIAEIEEQHLYVKLRLGAGYVLGRSFHYSET